MRKVHAAAGALHASVVFAFDAEADTTFPMPVPAPVFATTFAVNPEAADTEVYATPEGFALSVPPGSLTLAPFTDDAIYAVRVPLDRAPAFVPAGVDLVDLWALGPIQSTFSPPAAVAFPPDLGLIQGEGVGVYALGYATGLLARVSDATVADDGTASTADGGGIPELTWIALAREAQ